MTIIFNDNDEDLFLTVKDEDSTLFDNFLMYKSKISISTKSKILKIILKSNDKILWEGYSPVIDKITIEKNNIKIKYGNLVNIIQRNCKYNIKIIFLIIFTIIFILCIIFFYCKFLNKKLKFK